MRSLTLLFVVLIFFEASAEELKKHPVRQLSHWAESLKLPIEKKIKPASPALIDFLLKDNIKQGWPDKPKSAQADPELISDIQKAILELPTVVLERANAKLVGIALVTDLGGSAYAQSVFDSAGKLTKGFIVLDAAALNKKANEWATWKEKSPFDFKTDLRAIIESDANNNRKNALQYILLHEIGHILSIDHAQMPHWEDGWRSTEGLNQSEFLKQSWFVQDGKIRSHFDSNWSGRENVMYYPPDSKKLPSPSALYAYTQVTKTNFPTLYAATSVFDDFAESFANYVHVVMMKKPWEVSVSSGPINLTVKPCWSEKRCEQKKKLIEELLK